MTRHVDATGLRDVTSSPPLNPARILLVQTQAENAGAQEISRLVGAALAARGHEVHHLFFYRASDGCDGLDNAIVVSAKRPGGAAFPGFFLRLVSTIRRLKPDVVMTFQHYGNLFGGPAARLAGVRHVIANNVSAKATMNAGVRALERVIGSIGVFDEITVNSHDLLSEYHAYPEAYRRRLTLIPHGFEDKSVRLDRAAARARFGLPEGARLVGSVSRLHPLKRIDHALRLITTEPGWHFAQAGQGPDRERLEALARELGVADRFHLVGELPASGVGPFLAGLDAFVFPTEAETFGLAAVEAAQAGVPVVANDLPVLREVLAVDGEACALFVDTADTSSFAAAVRRVFDEPDLAAALAAGGRRLSERYSLQAMTDAYAAMVEQGPGGAHGAERDARRRSAAGASAA